MTLPAPGSVHLHKASNRLMRVVISDHESIVAHNCELAIRESKLPMVSWSGSIDQFDRAFRPADPALYPKSAA